MGSNFQLRAFSLSLPLLMSCMLASAAAGADGAKGTNGARDASTSPQINASLDQWLVGEERLAFAMLKTHQLENGAIIAAPSHQQPDYYYHWTRDAALVMTARLLELKSNSSQRGFKDQLLGIAAYLRFSQQTQNAANRSGGLDGLFNLGEPKFLVDGRGYPDGWGRPQSDGPALRALFLIKLKKLAEQSPALASGLAELGLATVIDQVLSKDLQYVQLRWQDSTYDLWEEVRGSHFYTRLVQQSALAAAATYFQAKGQFQAGLNYADGAAAIARSLERFWQPERGYLAATLDFAGGLDYKRLNLDTAVVLGALHTDLGHAAPFGPSDERILATAAHLKTAFANAFAINATGFDAAGNAIAPAIGRYPEDRYDGIGVSIGHPWFLTTLALGELHYRAAHHLTATGKLTLTPVNLGFFTSVSRSPSSLAAGQTLLAGSQAWRDLLVDLKAAGDAFLARVRYHAGADGALSEQFSRDNGYMHGAPDLTWSYAALLTAAAARANL